MSNKDFKTKNSLLAVCSHQDGQDSSDGMLNLGPSIDLVAATDATLEATGTFEFGDDLSLGRSNLIGNFGNSRKIQKPCTSLRQKFGLELVGTLDNSFTFGSCKRRTQPRLESSLGGNIGFFVNENDFSILKFHTLLLLNKCL
ncbi:hypothetical protein RhiirA4_466170 [Rhizophagus irregularis]|uniref:Uncharacterized protein n=1 Tax=Rhizophagus irregularis TaxID=588596 RepID=A0A2I1GTJ6_9GLOM|nr:hypothetical protein RhiirA4_466170 [Rhizophagus irregularis]